MCLAKTAKEIVQRDVCVIKRRDEMRWNDQQQIPGRRSRLIYMLVSICWVHCSIDLRVERVRDESCEESLGVSDALLPKRRWIVRRQL